MSAAAIPTAYIPPTETPSSTPTDTLTPTHTYTPTDTLTPTETRSPTPSITPSPTISDTPTITYTPSSTYTPSASPTFTPTATPTGPTETFTPTTIPYLYALRDNQVILTANSFNSAGCAWQGIGGQVFDTAGGEKTTASGLMVHVFGPNVDQKEPVGSNSIYGLSGWEVEVDTKINANTYFVELQSGSGTIISPRIQVTFPQDCAKNVALVRFVQTR